MKRRTENADKRLSSFADGQGVAIALLAVFIFIVLCIRYYHKDDFSSESSPAPVIVDVQGDVHCPGIHLLYASTVTFFEAIEAAGGLRPHGPANIRQSLSKQTLTTGDLLRVTRITGGAFEFKVEPMPARARLVLGKKLDPNRASVEELCLIPQMRLEFAEKIVARRQSKLWHDLEELKEIPGIGPKTIDKWRNHLEINFID